MIRRGVGRPKGSDAERKSYVLKSRVTKDTWDNLQEILESKNVSMSDYVRVAVEDAIERDLYYEDYDYER